MLAGLCLQATPAQAFQVKNVQSMNVSLSEEETNQSVNLSGPIDWSRTLLWNFPTTPPLIGSSPGNRKMNYAGEGDGYAAIYPESSTSVQYRRGLTQKPTGQSMQSVFYAVEFKDGVRVLRGDHAV